MNLPSIKTLRQVFDHRAKEARAILEMTRAQLEELPAAADMLRRCYGSPRTCDIRMVCLDAICEGSHGVEAFQLRDGSYCDYLNTGDTYNVTLLRVHGRYRVCCWGDIAERHA